MTSVQTKAYSAMHEALRTGKLVKRPCEVCGKTRVHGHHDNYALPLSVTWLCVKHHRSRHGELGRFNELLGSFEPSIYWGWV